MTLFSRIVLTTLTVAVTSSAFASTASTKRMSVKPVKVTAVSRTASGRMIVRADGSSYIQLQPSEESQITAQEMYEKYRETYRTSWQADDDAEAYRNYAVDRSRIAGIYNNGHTLPPRKGVIGIGLPGFDVVRGLKFTPTRDERFYSKKESYVMVMDRESGAYATANCRNPQGKPDVIGLNYGKSGCFAKVTIFKKF